MYMTEDTTHNCTEGKVQSDRNSLKRQEMDDKKKNCVCVCLHMYMTEDTTHGCTEDEEQSYTIQSEETGDG